MTKLKPDSEFKPIWNIRITLISALVLVLVAILAISMGPVALEFSKIVKTLLGLEGGLEGRERTLLLQIRLPRVVLGALVGAALATSGMVYQTVFRNPLADPYLLGTAAGAGLGATIAITSTNNSFNPALPIFAFIGGAAAVAATFLVSGRYFSNPGFCYFLV
jgi:iron complex transport system permease protein